MPNKREIEGTIRGIKPNIDEIKINHDWYSAGHGLVLQAIEYFPVGTEVKASVEGFTIKSLVKQDEQLIG